MFTHSNDTNKVLFGSEEIGTPKGFLAYSGVGNKTVRISILIVLTVTHTSLPLALANFCVVCVL